MATYCIRGRVTFNSASRRNTMETRIQTEATNRGFRVPSKPPGQTGTTRFTEGSRDGFTFYYISEDKPAIDEAQQDLHDLFDTNAFAGIFAVEYIY